MRNLQIKPSSNEGKIRVAINAPLTTKNATQPTRNSSSNALGCSKNSFFNRVIHVTGAAPARNSRNGYQQIATNTTYANSGNSKLLNSTLERGLSGTSGGRQ